MTTTLRGYKSVNYLFESPRWGRGYDGIHVVGRPWNDPHPRSYWDAYWDSIKLDYRLGLEVTPVTPTDADVTNGIDSGGFTVFTFRLGEWHTASGAADCYRHADGFVVIVDYESPDEVLFLDYADGQGCSEAWLSHGVVNGIWTATSMAAGTANSMQMATALGAAGGAVTYTVTDPDSSLVASGTAHHSSGGTYDLTLPAQSNLGRYEITWSGSWGGAREFLTYGRLS